MICKCKCKCLPEIHELSSLQQQLQPLCIVQAHKYSWVEGYSAEHGRAFFYNQETQESTWERPADLAWRRVAVHVSDEL